MARTGDAVRDGVVPVRVSWKDRCHRLVVVSCEGCTCHTRDIDIGSPREAEWELVRHAGWGHAVHVEFRLESVAPRRGGAEATDTGSPCSEAAWAYWSGAEAGVLVPQQEDGQGAGGDEGVAMEMDTDAEGEEEDCSGEETDREAAAVEDGIEDAEEETTDEEVGEEAPDVEEVDEDARYLGPEGGPVAGYGRDLGRRSGRREDSWRFSNYTDADEMTSDEAWQRRVTVSFTSPRD